VFDSVVGRCVDCSALNAVLYSVVLLLFRGSIAAVGAGQQEVVEIISQNEGMRSALKRLCDVLTPFLNEENTDVSEL
jgi:hypothetical protein